MDAEDAFVSLGREGWINALVEAFGEEDFFGDEWRRVLSEKGLHAEEPMVDVTPLCTLCKCLEGFIQKFIQVLCYPLESFCFLHVLI